MVAALKFPGGAEAARALFRVEDGKLFWLFLRGGRRAGTKKSSGYRTVRIDGHEYSEHRLIWLVLNGVEPNGEIDHRNGKKADNRISNLRDVSKNVNRQNTHHLVRGTDQVRNRWQARIMTNGKRLYLGLFKTEKEAQAVYQAARLVHHAEALS